MARVSGGGLHLTVVARGWVVNLLGAASYGLLSMVLVIVITRGLGVDRAGAFFEAVAVFSILAHATALGADTGVTRMVPRHRALDRRSDVGRMLSAALVPVLIVSILLAALLFATAPWLARVVADQPHVGLLGTLFRVMAPFLPIAAAYTVLIAATRGFGTMVPATVVDRVAKPALQPAFLLIALVGGAGGAAIGLAWTLPVAIGAILSAFWLASLLRGTRETGREPPTRRFRHLASEFWRFTAPRGLASVFQITILWLDVLLIGALASTREAGIYTAATRYVVTGMFAGVAIMQVLGPKLSELLTRNDHEQASHVYRAATAWLVALNWPIYLTLVLFAPFLLSLFGPGFGAGEGALMVLATTMLVATAVGPVDIVLLMGGKSVWNLFNTLVALTLNVVLNLILIPRFGIVGAALAWSASILFNNLAPLLQVWSSMRLHPFGRAGASAALAAVTCYGGVALLVRILLGPTLEGFLVSGLLATGLYVVLIWRSREGLELAALRDALRPRAQAPEPAEVLAR